MGTGSFLTAVVVTNRDRFITNWRDFRYYKLRKRLYKLWQALLLQIGAWLLQTEKLLQTGAKLQIRTVITNICTAKR